MDTTPPNTNCFCLVKGHTNVQHIRTRQIYFNWEKELKWGQELALLSVYNQCCNMCKDARARTNAIAVGHMNEDGDYGVETCAYVESEQKNTIPKEEPGLTSKLPASKLPTKGVRKGLGIFK